MLGACNHISTSKFLKSTAADGTHHESHSPPQLAAELHKSSATNYGFVARLSIELHLRAASGPHHQSPKPILRPVVGRTSEQEGAAWELEEDIIAVTPRG